MDADEKRKMEKKRKENEENKSITRSYDHTIVIRFSEIVAIKFVSNLISLIFA